MRRRIKGLTALALSLAMCVTAMPITARAMITEKEKNHIYISSDGLLNTYEEEHSIGISVHKPGWEYFVGDFSNEFWWRLGPEEKKYHDNANFWYLETYRDVGEIDFNKRNIFTTYFEKPQEYYICERTGEYSDELGYMDIITSREKFDVLDDNIKYSDDTYMKYSNAKYYEDDSGSYDIIYPEIEIIAQPKKVMISLYNCLSYEDISDDNMLDLREWDYYEACAYNLDNIYYDYASQLEETIMEDYNAKKDNYVIDCVDDYLDIDYSVYDANGEFVGVFGDVVDLDSLLTGSGFWECEILRLYEKYDLSHITVLPSYGNTIEYYDEPYFFKEEYYFAIHGGVKRGVNICYGDNVADKMPKESFYNIESWRLWNIQCGMVLASGDYDDKTGDFLNESLRMDTKYRLLPETFDVIFMTEDAITVEDKTPIDYTIPMYNGNGQKVSELTINAETKDDVKFDSEVSGCWKLEYTDKDENTVVYPNNGSFYTPKQMWDEAIETIGGTFDASKAKLIAVDNPCKISVDNNIANGSISVSNEYAEKGQVVTVNSSADRYYKIDKVYVDGKEIEKDISGAFKFVVTDDANVTATFAKKSKYLRVGNSTIIVNGKSYREEAEVICGENVTIIPGDSSNTEEVFGGWYIDFVETAKTIVDNEEVDSYTYVRDIVFGDKLTDKTCTFVMPEYVVCLSPEYVEKPEEPLEISLKASATTAKTGDTVTFNVEATGGLAPYKYSFLIWNKTGDTWYRVPFSTNATYNWKAGSEGERIFYVEVKCVTGEVVRSKGVKVVTSNVKPEITLTSDKEVTGVGDKVTFTSKASGMTGDCTYSYLIWNNDTDQWYRVPFSANAIYTWTAGSKGTRVFYAEVKDETGAVLRSKGVTVKTGVYGVNVKVDKNTAKVGDKVTFTVEAKNGKEPYQYSYIIWNKDTDQWFRVPFSSNSSYTWTAGSKGTRVFCVEAKDADGKVVRHSGVTVVTE